MRVGKKKKTVSNKVKAIAIFHEHSRFTGQDGKGEAISQTLLHNFHLLQRHLDVSRAITAESSLLYIVRRWTRIGNLVSEHGDSSRT